MALATPIAATRRATLRGWLGRARETHISLPLFALLLMLGIALATRHFITVERSTAETSARMSVRELLDTYEAQVQRNLGSIDQTMKVVKYAVERRGSRAALQELDSQGLLPSAVVFKVSIADSHGHIVASHPAGQEAPVGAQPYFTWHRTHATQDAFVSQVMADGGAVEPHIHFSRRLNDAGGAFAGVVIVEADPAYFTSGYEHARLGRHGAIGLYGSDGVMRALRSGDTVSWGQVVPKTGSGSDSEAAPSPWDGVARYTSMRRLHGFPLNVLAGLARDEQMAAFEQHRRNYLWAASGTCAVLAAIVALVCGWSWHSARSRRRIRRAQETYAAASEASLDSFFVLRSAVDNNGTIVDFVIEDVNRRAEKLLRQPREKLMGQCLMEVLPDLRRNGAFDDLVNVALVGGALEAEWQSSFPPRRIQWLHRQVVPVEGGVVAIVRDITERKLTEERIRHMAHHDELTGLPNRSLIRDRLDQAIRQAHRRGRCVALVFIDLDGFKLVNDGLGHNAGDELLKVVATRMGTCMRAEDTLGRFGGDEFVIVLSDLGENPLALTPLLDKVRQAVNEPVLLDGQEVQVGCSLGVVMYPRDGEDATTLMMNADAAMYRAKEVGNSYQFYTREMNASVEEKLVLLEGLRSALDEDQFQLLYQPKVDLRTGLILGVEALIRWHHPVHGSVPPMRFITLAEEAGLIVPIGEWVLETACRQNKAWQDAGFAPIIVSVNVSPRQFEDRRLVERVAAALQASGLPAACLELEVTESLIMRDLTQAIAKMGELESMGVSLSIDDFGTGYSSLSALKQFPIRSLKIDKSFVRELADNEDDQAIAMAVISLGHKLNLRVIAEGVETEQQCRFLRDNDCDEMQGYLFSRPVTAAQISVLLADQARMLNQPFHVGRVGVPNAPLAKTA
jgi:diguanylate cyclase (GGDEF)-like protein